MSFNDCDEHVGSGLFVALEKDGDVLPMVFMGEPVPREESFRGKPRWRFYFPVLTEAGLQVWGVASKTYRHIRDNWGIMGKKLFDVVRFGAKGSTDTTYEFKPKKLSAFWTKAIKAVSKGDVKEILDRLTEFDADEGTSS